jgi:hypothetical protein
MQLMAMRVVMPPDRRANRLGARNGLTWMSG